MHLRTTRARVRNDDVDDETSPYHHATLSDPRV